MSSTTLRFSRIFPSWRTRQLVFSSSSPFVSQLRSSSSDSKDKSTVFPVGSHLIFAWHPKQTVPYEHTKEIQRKSKAVKDDPKYQVIFERNAPPFSLEGKMDKCMLNIGQSIGIMVQDKETGQCKFFDADWVEFTPTLPSTNDDTLNATTDMSTDEAKARLTKSFGSEKSQRVLRARDIRNLRASAVLPSHTINDMCVEAEQSFTEESKIEMLTSNASRKVQASQVLPIYNPDATTPSEIYSLEHFFSLSDAEKICGDVENFLDNGDTVDEKGYSPFILSLRDRFVSLDRTNHLQKLACLYFMACLEKFRAFGGIRFTRADVFNKFDQSGVITENLLSEYSNTVAAGSNTKFVISKIQHDKIIATMITIALLMTDDFKVSLTYLRNSWTKGKPVPPGSLKKVAISLGCVVDSSAQAIATLKRPPIDIPGGMKKKRSGR